MQKRNRIFRWFMVLVLTISTVITGILPVSVAASTFTDVPDDALTFGPNESCNRGQIVTFLYRAVS